VVTLLTDQELERLHRLADRKGASLSGTVREILTRHLLQEDSK
jgi:hypothetical protein